MPWLHISPPRTGGLAASAPANGGRRNTAWTMQQHGLREVTQERKDEAAFDYLNTVKSAVQVQSGSTFAHPPWGESAPNARLWESHKMRTVMSEVLGRAVAGLPAAPKPARG